MTATKRRWFRFSLRTMFVATFLFAFWLAYHAHWVHSRHSSQDWIAESFDWNDPAVDDLCLLVGRGAVLDFDGNQLAIERRPSLPWTLWMLGESPRRFIRLKHTSDPVQLQTRASHLQSLYPEAQILPPTK